MHTDAHGSESDLTEVVIGSAFEVANVLGAGFLEKAYERAMIRELALRV
jgi:GxxExxY protein